MPRTPILLNFAVAMITVLAIAQGLPPCPASIQYAQTEAARIAYYAVGPEDGPSVLFVNGLPFSSHIWRDVISALDDGSRRLVAVDLVGFGNSTGTGFGVAEQVAHLDRFVAALDLKDLTVVGHDWGAGIGLILAHENARLMRSFAFADLRYLIDTYQASNIVVWMNEIIDSVGGAPRKRFDPAAGRKVELL